MPVTILLQWYETVYPTGKRVFTTEVLQFAGPRPMKPDGARFLLSRRALSGVFQTLRKFHASRSSINDDAQALAQAMESVHGGKWLARVDHEAGFILIRPRPGRPPP